MYLMIRAQRRKYHYIYKTTCNITNKFYIGMHSTSKLDDGYLGSGKLITRSINKHGKDNHQLEILEYLPNREELAKREFEIVNEELIQDKLCMNLQLGGGGGFTSEQQKLNGSKGNKTMAILREHDEEWVNSKAEKHSKSMKDGYANGTIIANPPDWTGRKHREETKDKMKATHKKNGTGVGKKNSQFGTTFIHNLELKKNKRVKKELVSDWTSKGWIKGAKFKWD